jgi:hypothetical protein
MNISITIACLCGNKGVYRLPVAFDIVHLSDGLDTSRHAIKPTPDGLKIICKKCNKELSIK